MGISSDDFKQILRQQQEQFEKSQLSLIKTTTQQFQIQLAEQNSTRNSSIFWQIL